MLYFLRREVLKTESFQEIYETYSRKVYGFLLNLSRSESTADELLQETFFQAFQHMDKFEGRCSIYTWLCQIGKNAFLKEIKRNKRWIASIVCILLLIPISMLTKAGGLQNYEFLSIEEQDECYYLRYNICVNDQIQNFVIIVTDKGITDIIADGSFLDDPMGRLAFWSEQLWEDYSGCYFDPDTKQYVYYK